MTAAIARNNPLLFDGRPGVVLSSFPRINSTAMSAMKELMIWFVRAYWLTAVVLYIAKMFTPWFDAATRYGKLKPVQSETERGWISLPFQITLPHGRAFTSFYVLGAIWTMALILFSRASDSDQVYIATYAKTVHNTSNRPF